MSRENLLKLADYLEGLPDDYGHFDMELFFARADEDIEEAATREKVTTCGTVACAVGHGPSAGIPAQKGEFWEGYSRRVFTSLPTHWDWCFGASWCRVDNTPKGASLRIRHLVENGPPKNAASQMLGEAPYMFADQVQ